MVTQATGQSPTQSSGEYPSPLPPRGMQPLISKSLKYEKPFHFFVVHVFLIFRLSIDGHP